MSWINIKADGLTNVLPVNDTEEHLLGLRCWCHPTRDEEDTNVLIHHSLDRREDLENHKGSA